MSSQSDFFELVLKLRLLLKSEHYSSSTIKDMEFILDSFSKYMNAHGMKRYSPEIGESLINYCEHDLCVCASRVSRARGIVRKLNRLQQGFEGREALWKRRATQPNISVELRDALDAYIFFLKENGNRDTTIRYRNWICGRFLEKLQELGCRRISEIEGTQIQQAYAMMGYARYWERIGPFLRFLFENGLLQYNYSNIVQYRRKHTPHPTVYSTNEILALENTVDRTTPAGIRNYAIILLLSRYGIRARDIAALSFENLDFAGNRIRFIQQKTGEPWECEMFQDVRAALLDYIQNVRPHVPECSRIFLTLIIPYKPIGNAVINSMVWALFEGSGIEIAGKRHGSRSLRSSIASNMINESVSTEIVRRVLGHGTKHAAKHYVKIDIENMRLCALPVPEPKGTFGELLSWKEGETHV